jgi:GT2 family glycosyltransferase
MKLAVLIPVHNHLEFTAATLTLLDEVQKKYPGELAIVVIDDGSSDGTGDYIASRFDKVHLLKGDGNLWWSGAVNMGARYAVHTLKADYLLLWNNDIVFRDDYFDRLFELLPRTSVDTVIGSKILVHENPDLVWSMGGCFNPRTGTYNMHGYYEQDSEKYSRPMEVDWLTGMGTIVPAHVLMRTGYWDAVNFPQYHGDSDFTYRAKLRGFTIVVHPDLILYNHVKSSGMEHRGSFRKLFRMLTDLRSKSNFSKKFKFYRLYSKSVRAYYPLFSSYFKLFGGFFKWKLLQLFGIKKKELVSK